jgi:hypothetical protein
MLRVVTDDEGRAEMRSGLDEIVLKGAQRMLAAALEAEVDAYIAGLAEQLDEDGRRLVVRNGHAEPRTITTAAGRIEVQAPRVNDRRVDDHTGERCRFRSSILPPWCRKSPKVAEVLPLMYLHGMSTLDFAPALSSFFGSAAGLSASVVTRLTRAWQDEAKAFAARRLDDRDYVYIWADGVHFNVRLEEDRLCALVIVGVRGDGTKELVAITDGYRESSESWADLLRDLKRRGMGAPVLAVGDGALGFWAALREVSGHQGPTLLGPQGGQLPERVAQVDPAHGSQDAGRDPRRRGPRPRPVGHRRLRLRVRDEVAEGRGQDRRRRRGAARLLRLPSRALDPPQDHQPDRVHLCHRAAAHPGDQGPGIERRRPGDGVQADRGGSGPVASGERTASRGSRPSRGPLREGGDRRARTAGSGRRRVISGRNRSTGLDYFSR